jgi:regulator of protease activity HflC (stomatin/prohibitin superfamily)
MNQVKEFLEYIFNAFKIFVIVQPWQNALIVRNGKIRKEVSGGIYFKIPYFDSVFVQENRLRVVLFSIQTLTSKDGQAITISTSLGYSINSIQKLYKSLYHPETTLGNIAMGFLADYVYANEVKNISPLNIEQLILEQLKKEDYGINFHYVKITNFAVVRTIRLIQDQSWGFEGLSMNEKK